MPLNKIKDGGMVAVVCNRLVPVIVCTKCQEQMITVVMVIVSGNCVITLY